MICLRCCRDMKQDAEMLDATLQDVTEWWPDAELLHYPNPQGERSKLAQIIEGDELLKRALR